MRAHARVQDGHPGASSTNSSDSAGRANECANVRVRDRHRGIAFQVSVPSSDIDACIKFSWVRCVYSIIGLLLVASDIPRTGNGVQSILDNYERVAPGRGVYFGPFAYGIAQITKTRNTSSSPYASFDGTCESEAIGSTDVWSYKFDSLSIPLRGIAHAFQVAAYPRCLLYDGECPSSTLTLETTFTMLDALTDSVDMQQRVFASNTSPPLVFHTQTYWVDRLCHFLLSKVLWWRRIDSRFFAIYFYHGAGRNASLNLCPAKSFRSPLFCEQSTAWTVDEVIDDGSTGSTTRRVKIADHITRRLSALERAYPHLRFDMTVFTTRFPTTGTSPVPHVPTVYFHSDNNEVTTLIRGRACTDDVRCETLLVDDYRYEIATLETDIAEWRHFTFMIRGFAQVYVWLRLACLFVGCYYARSSEPKFRASTRLQRVRATWLTLLKIPSHVVIYGSWLPIVLYAFAHYMDSGIVHTVCENLLSSLKGVVALSVVDYISIASVQMRNIWYVALVLKCVTAAQVHVAPQRRAPWTPRDGYVGIRSGVVGVISLGTVFGFLRDVRFRNADVLTLTALPPHALARLRQFTALAPTSEFGVPFDARVLCLNAALLTIVGALLKLYVLSADSPAHRALQRRVVLDARAITHIGASRMYLIPYSAGTLASRSTLSFFWKITVVHRSDTRNARHLHAATLPSLCGPRWSRVAAAETVRPSRIHNHAASSKLSLHEPQQQPSETLLHVGRRTPELWSVVKLMNIALLTEPLALLRLYGWGWGRVLYLYEYRRSTAADATAGSNGLQPSKLFLLPCSPAALAHATDAESSSDTYTLLATVDSRTVPWQLLVLCG